MPEYQRAGQAPSPVTQAIWTAIRRRRKPWTADDIAAASEASGRQVRRVVTALVRAGVVRTLDEQGNGAGGYSSAVYRLVSDLGPLAPRLLRSAADPEPTGIADRNSDMMPTEFSAARKTLGLSVRAFAAAIGYRDERTVRRFEAGGRPIPRAVADRVRALA